MFVEEYLRENKTIIIAEIGINHNGDFDLAKEMLHAAVECDVDVVKFQNFDADKLILKHVLPKPHLRSLYKSQHERFRSIELSETQLIDLAELTNKHGKIFMSTPSDPDGVDFIEAIAPAIKIGSDDLTNLPLIRHTVGKNKPIFLSTGLATTDEIVRVVSEIPKNLLLLLHCVSKYPTPFKEANLQAIPFLKGKFDVPVGYSDHTIGTVACLASVCYGAVVVEKHFTLNKNQEVGDHKLSADPKDMARLVIDIRNLEKCISVTDRQEPGTEEELDMSRKSLVTITDIPKGATITEDMILAMRPGGGISPLEIDRIVGRKSLQNIPRETMLKMDLLG